MNADAGTSRGAFALALLVAAAAGVTYAVTSHGTWEFDPLRFAERTQNGELEALLRPLHALANVVPLALFEGLEVLGYEGGALGPQSAVAVVGAAAATGLTLLAAARIGIPLYAATAAALLMAATLGAWRAGASAGVYGFTFAVLAAAWLVAVSYARGPSPRGLIALGIATGVAASTHLAAGTFAVAAALLVLAGGRPWTGSTSGRLAALGLLALAAAATAAAIFVATAGVATGWSPAEMLDWPRLGLSPAEMDQAFGFGLRGFGDTIAGRWTFIADLASVAATALALAGFVRLYRDQGQQRTLGVALLTHAVLAVLAAAWYWPEGYGNVFSLALVPLVLLWSRALSIPSLSPRARVGAAVAAATVALGLGVWNASQTVQPSLDRSRLRDQAADMIAAEVPSGSRILASAELAPLLAYRDLDASTGWAALEASLGEGAPRPGLEQYAAGETRSLVVTSRALVLTESQEAYLQTTEPELWSLLRSCCAPRPLFTVRTDAGPETAYLVRRPSTPPN